MNADRVLDVLGNIDESQQEEAREGLDIFIYDNWAGDNRNHPVNIPGTAGAITNGKIVKVGGIYRATCSIDSLSATYDEVYLLPDNVESPNEDAIVVGSGKTIETPIAAKDPTETFTLSLSGLSQNNSGIAYADGLIWVLSRNANPDIIRAIDPTTETENTSRTITLSQNANYGLTYGDGCLWVIDRATNPVTFRAFNATTGNEDTSKSFQPSGLHGNVVLAYDADDGIMWSCSTGQRVYAHSISDGSALTSRNITLNFSPHGLTYMNGKVYVANFGQIRIYDSSDGSSEDDFFISRSGTQTYAWIGYGNDGFWAVHIGISPDTYEYWQTENLERFIRIDTDTATSEEQIQIIWEA